MSDVVDERIRLHQKQADVDVTSASKAWAMRLAVEEKVQKLQMKMGKLVVVANPNLTDEWLWEVSKHPSPWPFS